MNLMSDAMSWLASQRNQTLRSPVVFTRAGEGGGSCEWLAEWGRSQFDVSDGDAGLLTTEGSDFIGRADALAIGGRPVVPRRGDTFDVGNGILWEIIDAVDGPYRYCDAQTRIDVRIHTIRKTPDKVKL